MLCTLELVEVDHLIFFSGGHVNYRQHLILKKNLVECNIRQELHMVGLPIFFMLNGQDPFCLSIHWNLINLDILLSIQTLLVYECNLLIITLIKVVREYTR